MTQIPGWPGGLGLRRFDTLDSTNEEARRLARRGESGPLWIVSRQQTMGRGRRGRAWVSQDGNLFATLLREAPSPRAAELGFVAGLAVAETIGTYAPSAEVRLKWPNDVLLEGRKTAGILLQALDGKAIAVGIGVNVAHCPSDIEFSANSIASATGFAPDLNHVLLRLARNMSAWYEIWRNEGFQPVREAWISRAAGLGGSIRARLAQGEMQGVFEGLDEDGALLLRDSGGALSRITAADIFLRP